MKISIIIPCLNEEKRIHQSLSAIAEFIQTQPHEFEVLVVDNGSKDKTKKKALSYQDVIPNLQVISEGSHGKGWAVKQGMLLATGDYRLMTDADNSTDIHYLEKLMKAAEEGYDVVISSRKLPLSHIMHRQPWYREILGNIFALLVSIIIPLGIKDTQNGFKLFSKAAAEKIFPHQSIYYWAWDVEVLAIAKLFGFRIKEVPVTWVNDDKSTMNIKGMVRMIFEVFATRIHLWTREYNKNKPVGDKLLKAEKIALLHSKREKNRKIVPLIHAQATK